MEGTVFSQLSVDSQPVDLWIMRHFQSFPFIGIKWTVSDHQVLIGKNVFDMIQSRDSETDWLCGGNIGISLNKSYVLSLNPSCKIKEGKAIPSKSYFYDQKALFTFQVVIYLLNSPDIRFTILLGCEREVDRSAWIREINETDMRQKYLQSLYKANMLSPSLSIYNGFVIDPDTFSLTNYKITDTSLQAIANYLVERPNNDCDIRNFIFSNTQLKDSKVKKVLKLLPTVQTLSLKDNFVTSVGAFYLSESLMKSSNLKCLNLSGNFISDEHMENIAYNLSQCKNLIDLNLSHNYLTNISVKSITLYLTTHSCRLKKLNLSFNNLGDGAAAIAGILMRIEPSIVEYLDISFCGIESVGITELSLALPYAKSLKSLNVRGSHANIQAEVEFVKAVTSHRQRYFSTIYPESKEGPPRYESIQVLIGGVGFGSDSYSNRKTEQKSLKFSLPFIYSQTLLKAVSLQRRWVNPIYKTSTGYLEESTERSSLSSPALQLYELTKLPDNKSLNDSWANDAVTENSEADLFQTASVLVDEFYQPSLSGTLSQNSSPRSTLTKSSIHHENRIKASNTIHKFVYIKAKLPQYIASQSEFLLALSQVLECDERQLKLMTTYQNPSNPHAVDAFDSNSTCIAFSMIDLDLSSIEVLQRRLLSKHLSSVMSPSGLGEFLVHRDYHASDRYRLNSDLILEKLKSMASCSHASLRMLGIQTVYMQYPMKTSQSSSLSYNVVHCKIEGSCHSMLDDKYEYFPILSQNRSKSDILPPVILDIDTDDEIEEPLNLPVTDRLENKDSDAVKPIVYPNYGQIAKRNRELRVMKARELSKRRHVNEQLVQSIRQLYNENDLSSSTAKFWEGAIGNTKAFRQLCQEGIESAVDNDGVFIAVGMRRDLIEIMFRRDTDMMSKQLDSLKMLYSKSNHDKSQYSSKDVSSFVVDSKSQGLIVLLCDRLYHEILSARNEGKILSELANHPSQLSLIEDFLLLCAKIGYAGPEVLDSVSKRQTLLAKGLRDYPSEFELKLQIIKQKALLCNLMLSRDLPGLKGCLDNITINSTQYELCRNLPEFIAAKDMLADYASSLSNLRQAISLRNISDLEDALAHMAYANFYVSDLIYQAVDVLQIISQNPKAKLLKPLVQALRVNSVENASAAIDMCSRAGWKHPAIQLSNLVKIINARIRIQGEDSFRSDIVKSALAIKNNITIPTGQLASLWRRINSTPGILSDDGLKQYVQIIGKRMKKLSGFVKLDSEVQALIADKDIDRLSDLVTGFGSSRIVIGCSSASVMNEWIDRLSDSTAGVVNRGGRVINENDEEFNDLVVISGTHDKLARSVVDANRARNGWKSRYFVLKGKYLTYYTGPEGEIKGQVRIRNGLARAMDPSEVDGRSHCIEVLEGIDLDSLDPNLLYEARKIVAQGKKKDIENILKLGIKVKSISTIENGFAEAKLLGVEVDESLIKEAKACVHYLQTIDMKRLLYIASIDVPIPKLGELLLSADKLGLDPGNSILQSVRRLADKSELQQNILRLRGAVIRGNDNQFRKIFGVITKYDHKIFNPQDKITFVGVCMQYIAYLSYRSYLDAESYQNIAKQLRHAVTCCSSFYAETEAVQLVSTIAKQQIKASVVAGSAPPPPPSIDPKKLSTLPSNRHSNSIIASQVSTATILQFFDDQHSYNQYLKSQYSIEKYPYLRIKSSKKGSGVLGFLFNSNKNNSSAVPSGSSSNLQQNLMLYSENKIKKALLSESEYPFLNQQSCVKMFEKIQLLMSEKNIESWSPDVSPGKSSSLSSILFDIIRFGQEHSINADEVYLQLCKQLTGNPSVKSRLQGWCIFSIFLHSFIMSYELIPFLKNFVSYSAASESVKLSNTSEPPDAFESQNSPENGIKNNRDSDDFMESIDFIVQIAGYCVKLLHKIEQTFVSKPLDFSSKILLESKTLNESKKERRRSSIKESSAVFELPSPSVVSRVMIRQTVTFEILLMTGSIYRFEVRYGEIDTPFSLLSLLYSRLVGGGKVLKPLCEFYGLKGRGLRDVNSKSPNVWIDYIIKQFRGMMFYLDEGSDVQSFGVRGNSSGRQGEINSLNDIPAQVEDVHRLDWEHDFIWDLMIATIPHSAPTPALLAKSRESDDIRRDSDSDWDYNQHTQSTKKNIRVRRLSQIFTSGTVPRLILRRVFSSSTETFSSQFELFDDHVSDRDTIAAKQMWISWLQSAVSSTKPLPADFIRIDLLFSEEVRLVNNRLYPMSNESLSYLAAIQLALNWENNKNSAYSPSLWGVENVHQVIPASSEGDLSIRPCYRTLPTANMYKSNIANFYLGRDSLTTGQSTKSLRQSIASQRTFSKKERISQNSTIESPSNQRISRFFRKSVVGSSNIDRVGSAIRRHSTRNDNTATENDNEGIVLPDIDEESNDGNEYYYYGDDSDDNADSEPDTAVASKPKSKYRSPKYKASVIPGRRGKASSRRSMSIGEDTSDDSGNNSDANEQEYSSDSSSESSSSSEEEDLTPTNQRVGEPLLSIKDISPIQMQGIRDRLLGMGIISTSDESKLSEDDDDIIDSVTQRFVAIHTLLHENGIPHSALESARGRYMLKRGYLQYLMTNPFYGHHFTSSLLSVPGVSIAGKYDEVVVAMSPQGLYLLDPTHWHMIFFTPLWDIEDIQIMPTGYKWTPPNPDPYLQNIEKRDSQNIKPIILSRPNLRFCVNGLDILLASDLATVEEQSRILNSCIYEAAARGMFPLGTESPVSGFALASEFSSLPFDVTRDAFRRFIRDCPLLPASPPMPTLNRAKTFFEPPQSRRKELADLRAEEEAKEIEESRRAAQVSIERLQSEVEKGRSAVSEFRRDGVDDDEDPADDDVNAQGDKTKKRRGKDVVQGVLLDSADNDQRRRADTSFHGVPTRKRGERRLFNIPNEPVRSGVGYRVVDATSAKALDIVKDKATALVWNKMPVFDELRSQLKEETTIMWPSSILSSGEQLRGKIKNLYGGSATWQENILTFHDRLNKIVDEELRGQQLILQHSLDLNGDGSQRTLDYYQPIGGIIKGKSVELVKRLKKDEQL